MALARALHRGIGAARRRLRGGRSSDLGAPAAEVLSRIDRAGRQTIADLARWQRVTPQTMGATVADLETRGFLDRRPDPHDGRRQFLSLTAAGSERVHQTREEDARRIAGALGEHLDPGEIDLVSRAAPLIERIADYL